MRGRKRHRKKARRLGDVRLIHSVLRQYVGQIGLAEDIPYLQRKLRSIRDRYCVRLNWDGRRLDNFTVEGPLR